MLWTLGVALALAVVLGGCVSGTYFDPDDRYATGLRLFDIGEPENAIQYWKPLAEEGDCDAQYRYGMLFYLGEGVPRDYDSAREWWAKAAHQGQYRAQMTLGTVYGRMSLTTGSFPRSLTVDCRRGCGVTRDPQQAYEWLRLAQTSLPPEAEAARQVRLEIAALEAELTPGQRADSERHISAWTPRENRCVQREL